MTEEEGITIGVQTEAQALKVAQYFLGKHSHVRDAILRWHEFKGYECCAHSEGQACCIDEILESIEPSA